MAILELVGCGKYFSAEQVLGVFTCFSGSFHFKMSSYYDVTIT